MPRAVVRQQRRITGLALRIIGSIPEVAFRMIPEVDLIAHFAARQQHGILKFKGIGLDPAVFWDFVNRVRPRYNVFERIRSVGARCNRTIHRIPLAVDTAQENVPALQSGLDRIAITFRVPVFEFDALDDPRAIVAKVVADLRRNHSTLRQDSEQHGEDGVRCALHPACLHPLADRVTARVQIGKFIIPQFVFRGQRIVRHRLRGQLDRIAEPVGSKQIDRPAGQSRLARIANAVGVQILVLVAAQRLQLYVAKLGSGPRQRIARRHADHLTGCVHVDFMFGGSGRLRPPRLHHLAYTQISQLRQIDFEPATLGGRIDQAVAVEFHAVRDTAGNYLIVLVQHFDRPAIQTRLARFMHSVAVDVLEFATVQDGHFEIAKVDSADHLLRSIDRDGVCPRRQGRRSGLPPADLRYFANGIGPKGDIGERIPTAFRKRIDVAAVVQIDVARDVGANDIAFGIH